MPDTGRYKWDRNIPRCNCGREIQFPIQTCECCEVLLCSECWDEHFVRQLQKANEEEPKA